MKPYTLGKSTKFYCKVDNHIRIKNRKVENWWEDRNEVTKATVRRFAKKLIESQRDLEPEIAKIVNDRFWDMV